MIICLIMYLCDHYFDRLLTQSMALCQSVALWTRLRRTSRSGMVETGIVAARLLGDSDPLVYVISFWIMSGIMVWSPDTYFVVAANLLLCDCFVVVGIEDPRIKVANDRGMTYSCQ